MTPSTAAPPSTTTTTSTVAVTTTISTTAATAAARTASCHPSYRGACLPPDASDVDCAGGTGNGPEYTSAKDIRVVGPDDYGLDDYGLDRDENRGRAGGRGLGSRGDGT